MVRAAALAPQLLGTSQLLRAKQLLGTAQLLEPLLGYRRH